MRTSVRVPARVHLAGNPSDGYGGAVLSAPVPELTAEVELDVADRFSVHGHPDGHGLVTAAVSVLDDLLPRDIERRPARISWSTTIPRSVGLGGSSAIVIATMRALLAWWDTSIDRSTLARAALAAEVDVLGLAGGIADRTVQTWEAIVRTDSRVEPPVVDSVELAQPIQLTMVWNERAAAPSSDYHEGLRARFVAGDETVRHAMAELAGLADRATVALERGDVGAFAHALDASLDVRLGLGPVPAAAVEPVGRLRADGHQVNFAGSGGSLIIAGDVAPPDGWSALPVTLSPAPAPSPSTRSGP